MGIRNDLEYRNQSDGWFLCGKNELPNENCNANFTRGGCD